MACRRRTVRGRREFHCRVRAGVQCGAVAPMSGKEQAGGSGRGRWQAGNERPGRHPENSRQAGRERRDPGRYLLQSPNVRKRRGAEIQQDPDRQAERSRPRSSPPELPMHRQEAEQAGR